MITSRTGLTYCLRNIAIALTGFSVVTGCGGAPPQHTPSLVAAFGQVLLDESPLPDADVQFFPLGKTEGIGGRARTDSDGIFQVRYERGGIGLPPGTYQVAVSKRVMPDGTPVPEDDETPPIESPARETLPPIYSDENQTDLRVSILDGEAIELSLNAD